MTDEVVKGVFGFLGVREVALVQDAFLVGMDNVGAVTSDDEAICLDNVFAKLLDVLVVQLVNLLHLAG